MSHSRMSRVWEQFGRPCESAELLHRWVRLYAQLNVPRRAVCAHHQAPFDYLAHSYFEPTRDVIVWAPRGGGKTRLAAVATLLDLLHKPGCAVRILGGSLEQSLRMWEHLLPDVERVAGDLLVNRRGGGTRRINLTSGSSAAVLTQSQRAVRGLRVQKLRCDEVELFDPDVWEAAQLVTKSRSARPNPEAAGPGHRSVPRLISGISGAVEALSTAHKPDGLMSRVIDQAKQSGTRLIQWCLLEVLERCAPERDCKTCPLWDECRGVAKTQCDGFFSIDDAIAMKKRVAVETWQSEIMCNRAVRQKTVFPTFDKRIHVIDADHRALQTDRLSLAIDFGFANPFVCLWIESRPGADGASTYVFDEYVQPQRLTSEHLEHIETRACGKVRRVACDPAGASRSDQTGRSNIHLLKHAGYLVRSRKSHIVPGLDLIRAALRPAHGPPKLLIHARCKRLITAMESYSYADNGSELPVKDGDHDHLIDALRYHFVNANALDGLKERRY